uniref:Uncharacterized protein n=1 Tax=Physcomitrium patens TaxID=3218 RepID=A0A7I4AKM1_PHYPA
MNGSYATGNVVCTMRSVESTSPAAWSWKMLAANWC